MLPPSLPLSPGIASLIRLLNSAGEESQPGLAVLLCEILTAVFLSLFVHGLATHCGGELFRIVGHPLSSKLWVTVFGGGARIPVMERVNSPARTPPPPSGQQAVQLMCLSFWQPAGVTGCVFVFFVFFVFLPLEVTQELNLISPAKLIGFLPAGHSEIHQPISVRAALLTPSL